MKQTFLFLFALFTMPFLGKAQEDYRISLAGINKVEFFTNSNIVVEKGTGKELYLKYENELQNNKNKKEIDARAQGLKPVYAGGVDNTGYGFIVEQSGGVLRMKDIKPFGQRRNLRLVLPDGIELHLDGGEIGAVQIDGISSEIVVITNLGDITMSNVTGPIVAHSTGGAIEISFVRMYQDSPSSISTSLGIIDVSIPANTAADVKLKSTMGTVYSNFNLETPREDGRQIIGDNSNVEGKLNNGGVSISMKSSAGNIYFRKK